MVVDHLTADDKDEAAQAAVAAAAAAEEEEDENEDDGCSYGRIADVASTFGVPIVALRATVDHLPGHALVLFLKSP